MDLAVGLMAGLQVLGQHLGHQVPTVGSGIDQHIVGLAGQGSVQHRLQRLVGPLPLLEGQIVTIDDEAFGPLLQLLDDLGQIGQLRLVHLHQPQTFIAERGQTGLDQG